MPLATPPPSDNEITMNAFHHSLRRFNEDLLVASNLLRRVEPILRSVAELVPPDQEGTRSNPVATAALIMDVQHQALALAERCLDLAIVLPSAPAGLLDATRAHLLSVADHLVPHMNTVAGELAAMAQRDHAEIMASAEMRALLRRVRQSGNQTA